MASASERSQGSRFTFQYMCGIAGVYLRDPSFRVDLDQMLDTLLLGIEDRGKHATGFVAIGNEGEIEWQKASCDATKFVKYRRWLPDTSRVVLGHTRWATQGEPAFMENNHPIKRGPFFIIHNGHVNNDSDLFKEAERSRYGQVDSEAIAARLSSYGDLKFLGNVIEEIDGDAAVAAVDERNSGALVLARGRSSPLWVYNSPRIVVFGSTMAAVEKAYEKHVGRLAKGGAKYIEEGTMLFWKGENEYWTKDLTIPKKWKYLQSGSDQGWSRDPMMGTIWENGGYAYSGRQLTRVTTTSEQKELDRALPLGSRDDWDADHLNYGWIPCDNCGEYLPWAESFDLWDTVKKYNESVCEDCYDMKLSQSLDDADEAVEAEWTDVDTASERLALAAFSGYEEEDGGYCGTGLFSEFEAANESILAGDTSEDTRSLVQMIRDRIAART